MTFPNFAAKHSAAPLVTPERMVQHLRERGLLEGFTAPRGLILLYHPGFARALLQREPHRSVLLYPDFLHLLERTDFEVGVLAFFGIGSPGVSALVETMAALGTRRFMNLGAAGGLQPDGKVGDLVVCDAAVRDEGVSHHYLPPARFAHPSAALTRELAEALRGKGFSFRQGPTWTVDAPYRETVEELRHYRDEGVLTVEMEAAALFAVAEHRGLEVAAGFVLSDTLSEVEWVPDFGSPAIAAGLDVLTATAIDILRT